MSKRHFVLNRNADLDIIHDPKRWGEQCNTDQIEGREQIDVHTAAQLIATGQARACEHCTSEDT